MKKLISVCLLLGLTSCGDSLKEKIAEKIPPIIAVSLECQNEDAIRHDFKKWLGVEEAKRVQSVWPSICKAAADVAIEQLAEHGIPADWECKADLAEDVLKGLLHEACDQIE